MSNKQEENIKTNEREVRTYSMEEALSEAKACKEFFASLRGSISEYVGRRWKTALSAYSNSLCGYNIGELKEQVKQIPYLEDLKLTWVPARDGHSVMDADFFNRTAKRMHEVSVSNLFNLYSCRKRLEFGLDNHNGGKQALLDAGGNDSTQWECSVILRYGWVPVVNWNVLSGTVHFTWSVPKVSSRYFISEVGENEHAAMQSLMTTANNIEKVTKFMAILEMKKELDEIISSEWED